MQKKKLVYISSQWFFDTDKTVITHLSRTYDVKWLCKINQDYSIINIHDIEELAKVNDISLDIIYVRGKELNISRIVAYYRIIQKCIKFKPDIIYLLIMHLYLLPFIFFINRNKLILGIHDVILHSGIRCAMIRQFIRDLFVYYSKKCCVFSRYQNQVFSKRYGCKKSVFMVGMSIKNYGEPNSSVLLPDINEKVKLLFFGRIDKYKGLDDFIIALEKRIEKGISKKLTLSICGKGPYWEECKKHIKHPEAYNLQIRFINDTEIPNLMSSHHFLVLPYKDGTQSGPVFIALNYSLPLICSNLNCFSSIYKSNSALLFDKCAIDDVFDKLLNIDNDEYRHMKIATETIRNNYTEDIIINNYIRYFES